MGDDPREGNDKLADVGPALLLVPFGSAEVEEWTERELDKLDEGFV